MVIVHSLCSLFSFVAFLIACVAGALFLLQERQLKRKTLGVLFHRLPSLEVLDRANFLAITIGLWCLSLGVAFGWLGQR